MLADGLAKGGIDRLLPHNVSNDCKYETKHEAFVHTMYQNVGSATMPRLEDGDPPSKEEQ